MSLTVCILAGIAAVAVAAFSLWTARSNLLELSRQNSALIEQAYLDQVNSRLQSTAAQLASQIANPLYFDDYSNITQRIQLAQSEPLFDEVLLLDPNGNLLNDGTDYFARLGEDRDLDQTSLQQLTSGQEVMLRSRGTTRALSPVELGQDVMGIIEITAATDQLLSEYRQNHDDLMAVAVGQIQDQATRTLALLVGLLLILWLVSRGLAKRLYQPVQQLKSQAILLGQGNAEDLQPIRRDDELGELADAVYAMARDLEMQNQSVKFLAFHDPLTGLLNRTGFQSRMEDDLEHLADNELRGALLFIDIDDFKEVNDSLGHEAGDRALRAISDRLRKNIGAMDSDWTIQHIARIGGDEFAVFVAPVLAEADIVLVAEDILSALTAPIVAEQERIHISASLGLANFPEDGDSVSALLNNADAAMYTSKHLGKGTYRFYEPDMSNALFRSSTIKTEFQKALRSDNQLELMFQPIVDLGNGAITSVEALIRWHHPRLGYLSPEQFIAIVEHNEVALSTDLWVLNQALSLLEQMNSRGAPPIAVSINISASNLVRKQFSSAVAKILKQREVLAERIKLEVTETFLHSDDDQAHRSMKRLGEMGFEIWLDDFGTGYSSLRHLKEFPVNGFKIDKSFIENLPDSPLNKKMVVALGGLAEAFSVNLVAEGIDNPESLRILKELGIPLGQGMLLGAPVSSALLINQLTQPQSEGKILHLGRE